MKVALPTRALKRGLTKHARDRMSRRGIGLASINDALVYGRYAHVRGTDIYAVGRKEVKRLAKKGIDLRKSEGVHVVCSSEGAIVTAYRNRKLSI